MLDPVWLHGYLRFLYFRVGTSLMSRWNKEFSMVLQHENGTRDKCSENHFLMEVGYSRPCSD